MRVDIWVRDDLTRRVDGAVRYRHVTGWDDPAAASAVHAAEHAWRVCALAPHVLDPEEQAWRTAWDAAARGHGLSVGDVVVAAGNALVCTPTGFDPTTLPG